MSNYREQESKLRELRAELSQRLDAVKRDLSQAHSGDSEEQAVERENDETLSSLGNEARQGIGQIDHALKRIEAGLYGTCESCGEKIDEARISALPFATQCLRCAEGQTHAH